MNKNEKINKGQIKLNVRQHYRLLESPMVEETGKRVLNLINELYQGNFIDEMTKGMALSNTNSASNTDILHLTKIHKPTTVGRPIIGSLSKAPMEISVMLTSHWVTIENPLSTLRNI